MSSEDCKLLIEKISAENGWSEKEKWKRTKKYKNGNDILRDFQNSQGDTITIGENSQGELFLSSMQKNEKIPNDILQYLNQEKLLLEWFKVGAKILKENYPKKEDAKNYFSRWGSGWKVIELFEKYFETDDEKILKEAIQTMKENTMEIESAYDIIFSIEYFMDDDPKEKEKMYEFVNDFSKEKIGVIYDKENIYGKLCQKEGISYLTVECGGDWEMPIIVFVYWSEKEGRLKSFFPQGDGNIYNKETNTAYGSEQEIPAVEQNEKLRTKYENMMEKINDNAEKLYAKAEENGFQQLKKEIMKDYQNQAKIKI
jgi:hypothetical protein